MCVHPLSLLSVGISLCVHPLSLLSVGNLDGRNRKRAAGPPGGCMMTPLTPYSINYLHEGI
jgi:hypothetical protein